jgi:LPXTG-motif cell wall-anchored protein
MQAGEVVTLTYKANISGDVDGGVYTDLAWAQGNNATVLSQGIASSYVNDEFVGTEVAIAKNTQTTASIDVKKTESKTNNEEVLGASTRLPRTGTSNIWVFLATLIMLSGFGFMGIGAKMLAIRGSDRPSRKIKRNFKVFRFIVQIMVIVGLFTVLVTEVSAAAVTTIRISLPQDRNNSNFKIRFVTLDSENRQITVKCFKKGPGDGSFVQFGSDIVLAPGGNSGTCNVDTSVVGTNGVSYQFMASAQAAGGGIVNSQVVGTSFSNASPGTPVNYSKQQNGCNYKIFFRTANDSGKTKKVEIYRSENTSFTADGGTKVGEVAANSNENKSFDNSADCGKKYYFVVRAFDDFGNGSGLTGDSEVTVNTTTNTTTTGGGTTDGGAIAVAPGQGNVGAPAVQGANEGTSPSPEASSESVLGATSEADAKTDAQEQEGWRKYLLWIIIGLAVAGAGYVFIAKRS